MKRLMGWLSVCLLALFVLIGCQTAPTTTKEEATTQKPSVTTAPVTTEKPFYEITLTEDYTLVYDDGDATLKAAVNTFVRAMKEAGLSISARTIDKAGEATGGEIVLGSVRDSASGAVALAKAHGDFVISVQEDDWILYATDNRLYPYLLAVAADTFLSRAENGAISLTTEDDFVLSQSELNETSYVDYQKEKSGKLTQVKVEALFERRVATLSDGTKMPYRLYLPHTYDPEKEYPVLLFLHGAGERGTDNNAQLKHVIGNLFNQDNTPVDEAIVICPQCPNDQQWVDTPWSAGNYRVKAVAESNELKGVLEILTAVGEEFSTDTDRYYAMGISMGGFGTWDLLMRHGDLFAAGVPICGGADPTEAKNLKDIPIYTVHGTADPIVPFYGTRMMVKALENAGSTACVFEELEGYEHDVWTYASAKEEILTWLFEKTLSARGE